MQTALPGHQVHQVDSARISMTPADVTERLASLAAPAMPAHLAAKVTDAIAAESARRQLLTAR